MRVDKVILKAMLSTLAAIAILCVLLVTSMCFLFPQTMMEVTYDWGMNGASIYFASVSYDRSGESYYAAFATETAIGANYDDMTEKFGEKLLMDDGFDEYAQVRVASMSGVTAEDYRAYIQGQVCVAKYDQGKKTDAVDSAFGYIGSTFYEGNPVATLYAAALTAEDSLFVNAMAVRMELFCDNVNSTAERAYLKKLISFAS